MNDYESSPIYTYVPTSHIATYLYNFLKMNPRMYLHHKRQQYTHWGLHHVGSVNHCRSNNVLDWQVLYKWHKNHHTLHV